ncbi:hypothetical protein JDV02_009215 [Purpureocillium takamizusanense]|uniref:Uncharacterized protein n=1 Tax=Purpureocillium takamizusanense TaxID=2060973 RepID=A0A9Q8QPH6_9HYPO|nr:uncharacterized protein JDV02_009215 [Purpureocillium takamizusanense]UNI23393.1 hypothetical protein JDV02_009215 [Purpureocillium takamizusanense]
MAGSAQPHHPEDDQAPSATKLVLKRAPPPTSHTESSAPAKSEVRFVLPGTRPEPETVRINTSDTSQPFLDPTVLQQWR